MITVFLAEEIRFMKEIKIIIYIYIYIFIKVRNKKYVHQMR